MFKLLMVKVKTLILPPLAQAAIARGRPLAEEYLTKGYATFSPLKKEKQASQKG